MPSHHAKQMQAKKSSQTVENLPATVWVGPRGRGARQTVLTPELPSPSMSTHRRRKPNTEAAWCWFEERKKKQHTTIHHPSDPTNNKAAVCSLAAVHAPITRWPRDQPPLWDGVGRGWVVCNTVLATVYAALCSCYFYCRRFGVSEGKLFLLSSRLV